MPEPIRSTPRTPADARGASRHSVGRARRGRPFARPPWTPVAQVATGGGLSAGGNGDEADDRRAQRHASGEKRPGRQSERLRVLVVEDEAVISMEIEDMLEGLGCTVVGIAHNAEEAVRLAERERPDVVTMDVSLPGGGDGVTAATEIFERYGLRSLFISAYTDPETIARARPARPIGWLRKPLTSRGLAAALEALPGHED